MLWQWAGGWSEAGHARADAEPPAGRSLLRCWLRKPSLAAERGGCCVFSWSGNGSAHRAESVGVPPPSLASQTSLPSWECRRRGAGTGTCGDAVSPSVSASVHGAASEDSRLSDRQFIRGGAPSGVGVGWCE